jgi:DNA-binding CsgD family transcriptional regulator
VTETYEHAVRLGHRTSRELEVLALLREGLRNADMAARLHIADKTVGHHVSAILAKLGVRSREDAARWTDGVDAKDGAPPRQGRESLPMPGSAHRPETRG